MGTLLTIDLIPRIGHQWRYPEKFTITQNLTDPSYTIDGYDGNKFDFTLNGDVDLELQNIKEGVEYRFILTVDRANASIPRPVSVYFSSLDNYCIAWKNLYTASPEITDNAEVRLYRAGNVIYAELILEHVGNGNESDGCVFGSNPDTPGEYDGNPETIVQDSTHRFVSDAEKSTWNSKADELGADDNYVTDAEKVKLSNLSGTNTGDQDLSGKSNVGHTHAQSEITNLVTDLGNKQATLVSGTNIKTINGVSVLGSGDIVVSGSGLEQYQVRRILRR